MHSDPPGNHGALVSYTKNLLPSVCALASPIPVLMLATVVALRHGFPTPTHALVKMAGLSLFVLNVAAFGSKKRWMFSGPALPWLALVAVSLLGLSPLASFPAAGWTIAGAGLILALLNVASLATRTGLLRTAALLLLGLALGSYAESMYWRSGAEHSIVFSEAMLGGQVQADVIEQAAIVNMIDSYGVASTGLDGLVPMKYHTGSLWLAQALRRLSGFQALDYIAFGYGLLLVPFYVAGIFACAAILRATIQKKMVEREEENSPPLAFWLTCSLAVVGLFPFTNDPNSWNFNETILNSDSLLLAFALSAWLIAIAATFYLSLQGRDRFFTLAEKLAFCIALPAALALIGFVKISQIYLLLALLLYLCWRVKWLRVWPMLFGVAISLLLVVVQMRTEVGAVTATFAPFRFDRIHPEWVPYFFVVYFSWAWLFLLLWARVRTVRSLADMLHAIRSRESLPVELVFVTVIASLVPYLLMDFHSPSWKFFTEFHAVLAGVFFAAFVPKIELSRLASKLRNGQLSLAASFGLVLALAVCGHLFMTTEGSAYRMVKSIGEARAGLAGKSLLDWRSQLRQIDTSPSSWAPAIMARENTLQCLETMGRQPRELRRTAALYIPKTNRYYWEMRQVGQGATPFIAPAESGLAMVNGLPEFEDIGWAATGWGYPQYKLPAAPESPATHIQEAAAKARLSGFQVLWVLSGLSPAGCDLDKISLN
jgi:hypothetical protein